MKLGLLFFTFILPSLAFSQWNVIRSPRKSEVYETYLVMRYAKLGKAERLAAVIQNSRVSSEIIPNFKKSKTDEIAKYLLKHFSNTQMEKMGGVSFYRAESPTDHVRLLIKKRKNDYLVSFAMVKRSFLDRSYNETDFLQRLFIAEENFKSGEKKGVFHFLAPFFPEAHAAGFSLTPEQLQNFFGGTGNSLNVNIDTTPINNLVNTAQQIAPSVNNLGNSISNSAAGVTGGLNNVSNSITGLNSSIDRAGSGATAGMKGIETQLGRISDIVSNGATFRNAGLNFGFGFGVGMIGANLLATVASGALKIAKDFLFDIAGWYKGGEEEAYLKDGLMALNELEGLHKKTDSLELYIQNLDIALQLASGRPVEKLFTQRTQMGLPTKENGLPDDFCESPFKDLSAEKREELRQIGEAIKNDPKVREHLCQKLEESMKVLEDLTTEMTVARARLMSNILVVTNNAMSVKQKSLATPKAMNKAVNKCEDMLDDRAKFHTERYNKLNCSSQGGSSECLALQKMISDVGIKKAECQRNADRVIQTFNDNYVEVAASIETMENKSQKIMQDFLMSECRAEERKESCKDVNGNYVDGDLEKAKKRYREKLADLNRSGCPMLKTDRFMPKKELLAGQLRTQQDTLPQETPVSTASNFNTAQPSSYDPRYGAEGGFTSAASASAPARSVTSSSSGGGLFSAIGGFFKSIFGWFF